MKHWHVVHTKPRQEVMALENLERQGYTCFLPTLPVQKVNRGKVQTILEPLFPRYIFIQLEHGDAGAGLQPQTWSPIRSTLGVQRLVSFGHSPAIVDEALVAELMAQSGANISPKNLFDDNAPVLITKGAFAGVEGVYQRLAQMPDGQARAFVLIELLSKKVELPIEPRHLKKREF